LLPPILKYLLLFTFSVVQIFLPQDARARVWTMNDLSMEMGTLSVSAKGVSLTPNASGRIYFTLPAEGLSLSEEHLLHLEFEERAPTILFLMWRNTQKPELLQQYRLPPQQNNSVSFDMSTAPGWEGKATQLGIGIGLDPSQQLILRGVALRSPDLLAYAGRLWRNWSTFRPWKAVDINIHTGTRQFGEGPHPVPVFAATAGVLILVYGLWSLLRRNGRQFEWQCVGALILCTWLASDLFWQLRLWRQTTITWQTFHGKTSQQKLLASEDAAIVGFTDAVKKQIDDPRARVFIASSSDRTAMLTAYYMAPLNTFWHRHGPELPPAEQIRIGDYILLTAPSTVNYEGTANAIHFKDGASLSVEPLHKTTLSVLLKVGQ
jgi:hypothetical protein